jgi:hypothetical protein
MVHNILNKLLVVALAFDVAQTLCPVYHRRPRNTKGLSGTGDNYFETWGIAKLKLRLSCELISMSCMERGFSPLFTGLEKHVGNR